MPRSSTPRLRPVRRVTALLAASAILSLPGRVTAQAGSADIPACLGFAFGTWTPALDYRAAGHAPPVPGAITPPPGGRDWAVNFDRGDSVLVLFPSWWPVGVTITFPRPPRAFGDTVVGQAVALVADGRRTPPRSRARAWMVRCGG